MGLAWRLALFWVLCCLCLVTVTSCGRNEDDALPQVIIISPHGSDIRREFEKGFSKWHEKKYGTKVKVRWPDIAGGGTGNIVQYLDGEYKKEGSTGSGYDLFFGGGSAIFQQCRDRGYLVRPPLPEEAFARVPKEIFGTALHGGGDMWIAATMSNFGIVYNKDRMSELGLATPRVWEDLAGPKWFGTLSLADPSKSGSVRSSYDQIFLQYGWEKGWGLVVRMFANTENMRVSGSAPADDVGGAQAVAGIVIDFYGRKEVLRVGESLAGFMIPEGGSITDPDPIAMLKGAPHPELAAHFIEFVIGEEGQRLWTLRAGTPGGPEHYVLGRLSVLPDLYKTDAQYMFDPRSPFDAAQPLKGDELATRWRSAFMGELIKSALIDNRSEILAARRAVLEAGDPSELLARFDELPSFIPTQMVDGKLVYGAKRPITKDDQKAVAEEFKPTDKAKAKEAERLQTGLRDLWQGEFRERMQKIRADATRTK